MIIIKIGRRRSHFNYRDRVRELSQRGEELRKLSHKLQVPREYLWRVCVIEPMYIRVDMDTLMYGRPCVAMRTHKID